MKDEFQNDEFQNDEFNHVEIDADEADKIKLQLEPDTNGPESGEKEGDEPDTGGEGDEAEPMSDEEFAKELKELMEEEPDGGKKKKKKKGGLFGRKRSPFQGDPAAVF